jgi:hypothetical protein
MDLRKSTESRSVHFVLGLEVTPYFCSHLLPHSYVEFHSICKCIMVTDSLGRCSVVLEYPTRSMNQLQQVVLIRLQ